MPSIFICHRRDDSIGHAHRVADRLTAELGAEHVFIDLNSIPSGADWKQVLDDRLTGTCLMLAIVGKRWLTGAGSVNRLQDEGDFVRRELATAFAKRIAVLPVLVDGAELPKEADLPPDVQRICGLQALTLPTEDQYFDAGIQEILERHRAICSPRRRQSRLIAAAAAAILLLAGAAGFSYWLTTSRRPNFVVQVFKDVPAAPLAARVQMRSLLSDDQQVVDTDGDGHARFRVKNADLVQLRVTLPSEQPCRSTLLPAFTPRELPALNPVDVAAISARLWTDCGAAASQAGTTTGRSTTLATLRAVTGRDLGVRGDRALLKFHMPWGVPQAETVVARRPYAFGFDSSLKIARWVGYRVQRGDPRRRRSSTYPFDPLLPVAAQARPDAYNQNPYDRGNLVTRAEVSALDEAAEDETFYMSVIAPQTDFLNQQVWTRIEAISARQPASARIWVITGPAFVPEEGKTDVHFAMLPGDVAIPTHFFRVMAREDAGGALQLLAFLVPNGFGLNRDPKSYLTSVEQIERVTGLRFFSSRPESERQGLLKNVARDLWAETPAPVTPPRPGR
jgi:DNA/RNA endonuclease G (NUC1)